MGMSSRNQNDDLMPMSEINVTPLVDVMLVLLIIFMVTSPMLVAGIQVDLPETQAAPIEAQKEPLSITIDKKGQVYIQEKKVTVEHLGEKVKAIGGENKDLRIYVRGDKHLDYGKVMEVVGILNTAGFHKIGLITEIK